MYSLTTHFKYQSTLVLGIKQVVTIKIMRVSNYSLALLPPRHFAISFSESRKILA